MAEDLPFKVVDLSVPLKSMATAVFPGSPQPLRSVLTTLEGNGYFSNVWTLVEHTGTHVDAPAHFIRGGASVEKVPLEACVGRGAVLDFGDLGPNYSITQEDIEERLRKKGLRERVGPGWVLLFRTGYGSKAGTPQWMEHPVLSAAACKFILELKVGAVGFDAPSPDHSPFVAHKSLLPEGLAIFENLSGLDRVMDEEFVFVGAPLALVGGSASPVRAFALIR